MNVYEDGIWQGCWGLKWGQQITQVGNLKARKGHEMSLAHKIKEIPKAFYKCIKNKRVMRGMEDRSRIKEIIFAWSQMVQVMY